MEVAAIQMPHGGNVFAAADAMLAEAAGVRLALLPEYWWAMDGVGLDPAKLRAWLIEKSATMAVASNIVENGHNLGVVYDGGCLVLEQAKVHPMPREVDAGIVGGNAWNIGVVDGTTTGMLVCADVLYPEASQILSLAGATLLLNPVMSPYRTPDPERDARTALYIARAYDAGAFVVKAGGFDRGKIAGRSLIAAPWGVLAKAEGDFAPCALRARLDFERLEVFRSSRARFPARRPDTYGPLT